MTIKNHLKSFVRNIVEEAVLKEIAGASVDAVTATARLTPNQRQVVASLMQRKFKPAKYIDAGNNQISVVLEQPYSRTSDEGNRFAHVTPNGRINRDQLDLKTFLKGVVGEGQPVGGVKNDHEFDDGRQSVMRAVNVEESTSKQEGDTVQVADGSGIDSGKIGVIVPTQFKQTSGGLIPDEPGAYKPLSKGWLSVKFEDGHVASFPASRLQIPFSFLKSTDQTALKEGGYDERPCDCGSRLMSRWVLDARNIPLVRACDKCREDKLSHFRKDVLTNPNYEADEPIEPDEQEEQTGTGAIAGYSTPLAFKKKVKEKIGIDGRYDDDMESALQSKKISGMSETSMSPYDSELDVHGRACPCGSGLPSHIKMGATGKTLARVCRKCDKPNPKTVKDYRASERYKRRIPRKFDEIANFGQAVISTVGSIALYRILRKILDSMAAHREWNEWKNKRLTPSNMDIIFKSVKLKHPELTDESIEWFKKEVQLAIEEGGIKTIDDLKRYFETKKLEETKKGSVVDYAIMKKVKNASYRFFKTHVESIQIAHKAASDDIIFELILGSPKWSRVFIRFHGLNRPFEVWDENKERFVSTNMLVRNFQEGETEELNEALGFGMGFVAGTVGKFFLRILKDIFDVIATKRLKKLPLTEQHINMIIHLAKLRDQTLDEDDVEYMKTVIHDAIQHGTKTIGGLLVYIKHIRGPSSVMAKAEGMAHQLFGSRNVVTIKIARKVSVDDIIFLVVLGPPKNERKFIRYRGMNKPFEIFNQGKRRYESIPTHVRGMHGLNEVGGFEAGLGAGALVGAAAVIFFRILKDIFSKPPFKRIKELSLTEKNINFVLYLAKLRKPELTDEDIKYMRHLLTTAAKSGKVQTLEEFFEYLKTMRDVTKKSDDTIDVETSQGDDSLKENEVGVSPALLSKVKNIATSLFGDIVAGVKVSRRVHANDIVFMVVLGPPKNEKKYIRFHGDGDFELWDAAKKKYDKIPINIKEMTGTGAVAGYATPFAFTKHKDGSKRALDVTKKLGFKVVKSISEEENIIT
jgi:hypothetical protein